MLNKIAADFKSIIVSQKDSLEKLGNVTPGILLINDEEQYFFISLVDPLNQFTNDVKGLIDNILIPSIQKASMGSVVRYLICFSMATPTYNTMGVMIPPNKHDAMVNKFLIIHGNYGGEEIREYWLPSLREDRKCRSNSNRRTVLTEGLEPYIKADPGMFRGDLLSERKEPVLGLLRY